MSKLNQVTEWFEKRLERYPKKPIPTPEVSAMLKSIDYISQARKDRAIDTLYDREARVLTRRFGPPAEPDATERIRRLVHAPVPLKGNATAAGGAYFDYSAATPDQLKHIINGRVRRAGHELYEVALAIAMLDLHYDEKYTPPFRIPKSIMDEAYDAARKLLA